MLCTRGSIVKGQFRATRDELEKAKRAMDFASGGPEFDRLQSKFRQAERDRLEALTEWWLHLKSCKDCRGDLGSE